MDVILGFHPRDFRLDDGCYLPCWCPNKPVQQRDHSEKVSVTMALCVVLVVEVEVTEIKELDFIEYLQWQPTKENLKKN